MSTRVRWVMLAVLLAAPAAGCHRREYVRRRPLAADPPLISAEPALTDPALVDPRRPAFVERHPVFRKPVEYSERGGPSPIRKAAAATFVGIPAGILGEMRQIVVGSPPGY